METWVRFVACVFVPLVLPCPFYEASQSQWCCLTIILISRLRRWQGMKNGTLKLCFSHTRCTRAGEPQESFPWINLSRNMELHVQLSFWKHTNWLPFPSSCNSNLCPSSLEGSYFLRTNPTSPYALGDTQWQAPRRGILSAWQPHTAVTCCTINKTSDSIHSETYSFFTCQLWCF